MVVENVENFRCLYARTRSWNTTLECFVTQQTGAVNQFSRGTYGGKQKRLICILEGLKSTFWFSFSAKIKFRTHSCRKLKKPKSSNVLKFSFTETLSDLYHHFFWTSVFEPWRKVARIVEVKSKFKKPFSSQTEYSFQSLHISDSAFCIMAWISSVMYGPCFVIASDKARSKCCRKTRAELSADHESWIIAIKLTLRE